MPRLLAIAGAAVILVAMTGCIQPKPPATPTPTPSAAPVFASEEEALAAAEESYARYVAVLDAALATYDVSDLENVASGRALEEALGSVQGFRDQRHVLIGSSSVDSLRLIEYSPSGDVSSYACLDVSATDVLDAEGKSAVAVDRPLRYPMQVDAETQAPTLVISSAEVWDGDNFCD